MYSSHFKKAGGPWSPSSEDYYPPVSYRTITELKEGEFSQFALLNSSSPWKESGIKVLFHVSKQQTHFIETTNNTTHFHFCTVTLGDTRNLTQFNEQVYTGEDRSIICATIVRYPNSGKGALYTFEMSPADPLDTKSSYPVEKAFKHFRTAFQGVDLKFRLTSSRQRQHLASDAAHPLAALPMVELDNQFSAPYFIYVNKHGAGTLRFLSDASAKTIEAFGIDDILVLPSVPNDIPPVAGVIVGEQLPAFCHVQLLCQNRHTPCIYLRDLAHLRQFDGKHVILETREETPDPLVACRVFEVKIAEDKERAAYLAKQLRSRKADFTNKITPINKNFSEVKRLVGILPDDKTREPASVAGGKATNCRRLDILFHQKFFTEAAFVIPFGAYLKHVATPWATFQSFLSDKAKTSTAIPAGTTSSPHTFSPTKADDLAKIQRLVDKPLSADTKKNVVERALKLLESFKGGKAVFRSSSNIEDVPGFNAAGLHKSVVVRNVKDQDEVETAIVKVWASVWTRKALAERIYAGVPAWTEVAMAILVQPYFDAEEILLNGVALTYNVYSRYKYGVTLSCYAGGAHRATDTYPGISPETTVVHMSRTPTACDTELIKLASDGKAVVDFETAARIGKACREIHKDMLRIDISYVGSPCMDIEFLVLKEKENSHGTTRPRLVFLQARQFHYL